MEKKDNLEEKSITIENIGGAVKISYLGINPLECSRGEQTSYQHIADKVLSTRLNDLPKKIVISY